MVARRPPQGGEPNIELLNFAVALSCDQERLVFLLILHLRYTEIRNEQHCCLFTFLS